MKEATVLENVGNALRSTTKYLTIAQIAKAAKVEGDLVKVCLKLLAEAGQIEVIPGTTRQEARYGWLASAKPVVPAAAALAETAPADPDEPEAPGEPVPVNVTLDALCDDIATTLRSSGIAAFAHVNAGSDLAMAVAGLVEEYRKAQAQPVPPEPDEPKSTAYLVKASKRKPRITRDKDAACAAALAAARKGSTRAEVFALIPVGAAKPGAEWNAAL
jgi:hypothetical protein